MKRRKPFTAKAARGLMHVLTLGAGDVEATTDERSMAELSDINAGLDWAWNQILTRHPEVIP